MKKTAFKNKGKGLKRTGFKKKGKPLRKKSKKLTIARQREKTWGVFSKHIRSEGRVGDYNRCITCGVTLHISELHAGHFLHGKNKATYFLEDNVHPQCPRCNHWKSGNLIQYTLFMDNNYGLDRIKELQELHKKPHLWKRSELEELYEKYATKTRGECRTCEGTGSCAVHELEDSPCSACNGTGSET